MRQCMRCGKACKATFCDNCRSFLREQLQKSGVVPTDVSRYATSPLSAVKGPTLKEPIIDDPVTPLPPIDDVYMMQVEQMLQASENNPITPLPPVNDDYNGQQAEQALHNLQDAARRIEAFEQSKHRSLHASRLSPLRDISADIQRKSTPIPQTLNKKVYEDIEDLGDLPDLWSWLSELPEDEGEEFAEQGENDVDPLVSRHFPRRAESVRIEEADLKRAVSDGLATTSQIEIYKRLQAKRRLRVIFICLAVLAVLALIVDSVLGAFVLWHGVNGTKSGAHEPPTFMLSSTLVDYGQKVTLSIRNFPPSTTVYLTHDVNEPIKTLPGGKSVLQVGNDGAVQASTLIDTTWEAGFHTLQAEDMKTRYTASVTLRVNGGSIQPAHVTVNTKALDLGAAAQGSTSMQELELHNSGNGAVSWVASSNQPWLQMTPSQGTFSESQTMMVGGQRANLQPGNYQGIITITSNVGSPITITVKMTVLALPPDAGAVLAITPAVLSYTAIDGAVDPSAQRLTINNPGKQPLYWSLSSRAIAAANQDATGGSATNWLGADHSSGMVAPGKNATIQVLAHSRNLMPGTYLSSLVFSGGKDSATTDSSKEDYRVYNAPQSVSISLTVQEHCGLALNTSNLAFTAVAEQDNPSNQTLNLSADTGCPDAISWKAISSANWVTMTPANGQLTGTDTVPMSVGINTSNLRRPGVYTTTLLITTKQSSHTVTVQLTLQKQPTPTAPIMSAAPLNLNFAANQGQGNLPGQTVTITNSGHSILHWDSTTDAQLDPWLTTTPTSGTIAPGQMAQMTVTVNAGSLPPGSYTAQIQLNGTDATHALAGGSPQSVVVNFQVSTPCVLAKPSSSSLAFNATQGGNDPAPQNISITASGNCSWPLNWSLQNIPSWLKLSSTSGTLTANNPTATISVAPSLANLTANQNVQIPIAVTDSANEQVQVSPASFGVSLTVQPPCSVKIIPNSLTFTATQGQATIAVQASDACSSVSWHAVADDGNTDWLSVNTGGSNDGGILVKADGSNLNAGATYTGSITVTVSDSSGNPVQGGTQTIAVSLKIPVSTFTISGTVSACTDTACNVLQPLGNAQVILIDSSGQHTKTTTADGSGNFSFSNVNSGSYTIESSGTDSTNISYSGSKTILVSGDQQVALQDAASTPTTGATPLVAQ
ncbi:hypothetical protein KSF_042210 [Reticulibacter mediterranei]|uniref:BACON domain-containing protein n=1 Tax=Reticulibacter mediterranei TaxID=2778369 RepID=A0A8J3IIC3_9CHLR|nr:carboxypeptidase regulatory-like domain-containing protein [Reticulibacter mediterranei]GHO94173.1 hypothetical protein KSF_042210 [Reticulibacter mediterranei]